MPLLAGVFLRDLQLDGFICFFEAAEERRNRLAHLEINRPVFDLDDYVVVELAVERMKDVVGGARAIILGIAPIEMMVIDKGAVKNDSVMRGKSARNHIGGIGGRSAIRGGTEAAFGIRLDDEAGEIRNLAINFVHFFCHQSATRGSAGSKVSRPPITFGLLRSTEMDSCTPQGRNTSATRASCGRKSVFKDARIGVHIVDRAAVDSDGSEQARVFAGARQVGSHISVFEKDGRSRVSTLNAAVEVVPLVHPANRGGGLLRFVQSGNTFVLARSC